MIKLLSKLYLKFRSNPSQTKIYSIWIQNIIYSHSELLNPSSSSSSLKNEENVQIQQILCELYQNIDYRLTTMNALMRLQGRLKLIQTKVCFFGFFFGFFIVFLVVFLR